jgi:hypothetical protein
MKTKLIILLTLIITSTSIFSQDHNSLIGTWQWENGNQRFELSLYREYRVSDNENFSTIDGDFTMYQTDNSGNETVLYTSDRPINPNDPNSMNFPPAITGGAYKTYINSTGEKRYNFWLMDTVGLPNEKIHDAELWLKIIYPDLNSNDPLQLEWQLKPRHMIGSPIDEYNVPIDITLTKIE